MTKITPKHVEEVPQAPTPEQKRVSATGVVSEAVRSSIIGDYVGCPLPPSAMPVPKDPSRYSGHPCLNMP